MTQKIIKKRFLVLLLGVSGLFLFLRSSYEVPILMYHHVGNPADSSSLNVSLKTFERQMEFLKIHGYRVVSLSELLQKVKQKKTIPFNTVVITFDDGHLDNIEYAFPVLRKMNFPATLFMIVENLNKEGWLSEEDLKILEDSQVSIGSHTVHHAYLPDLKSEEAMSELNESKQRLEQILGHPVTLLSYPAGGFSEPVQLLAKDAGYEGAITTNRGVRKLDPYALRRVKITEGKGSLLNFWAKTSGFYRLGKRRRAESG